MAFQAGTLARNIFLRKAYGYSGDLNTKLMTAGVSQTVTLGDFLSLGGYSGSGAGTGKLGQYISSGSLTANTANVKAAGYATTSGPFGLATSSWTSNASGQITASGITVSQATVTILDDVCEIALQGLTAAAGTASAVTAAIFTSFTVGSAYGLCRVGIGSAIALSYAVSVSATTTGEFVVLELNGDPNNTTTTNYPLIWGKIIAAGRQY